jgi:hypothetical protein
MLCSSRTCSGNDEKGLQLFFFFLFFVPQVKAHWQRAGRSFTCTPLGLRTQDLFWGQPYNFVTTLLVEVKIITSRSKDIVVFLSNHWEQLWIIFLSHSHVSESRIICSVFSGKEIQFDLTWILWVNIKMKLNDFECMCYSIFVVSYTKINK